MEKIQTRILSVLPMRTQVVFPDTTMAFDVGRGVSLAALEHAKGDELVFLTRQKDANKEVPEGIDLFEVGTVARICHTTRLSGDRLRVIAEGLYRARARDFRTDEGYIYAVCDGIRTIRGDATLEEAYFRTAQELVKDIVSSARSPRTCARTSINRRRSTSCASS